MAWNVRLSDQARADIENIAKYLAENWSEKSKIDFLVSLTARLDLISQMPFLCKASPARPDVHECVLKKHTVIYYQIVDEEKIVVLTIRNTRRANS